MGLSRFVSKCRRERSLQEIQHTTLGRLHQAHPHDSEDLPGRCHRGLDFAGIARLSSRDKHACVLHRTGRLSNPDHEIYNKNPFVPSNLLSKLQGPSIVGPEAGESGYHFVLT